MLQSAVALRVTRESIVLKTLTSVLVPLAKMEACVRTNREALNVTALQALMVETFANKCWLMLRPDAAGH